MTARLQQVAADPAVAATLIEQAERHLASARSLDGDPQAGYGLCWQACLKGLTAVLTASGLRVTSGPGAHAVTLREAAAVLELDEGLGRRLDHMRRTRHRAFYETDDVSAVELEGAIADCAALLATVRAWMP